MFKHEEPTHPSSLLDEPGVQLLSDELQHPADDDPDVLHMVGSQCLVEAQRGSISVGELYFEK